MTKDKDRTLAMGDEPTLLGPRSELCARAPRRSSTVAARGASETDATRAAEPWGDAFDSRVDELRRLYIAGEAEAALDLAAAVWSVSCAQLSLAARPVIVRSREEILALPLDPRSAFLIQQIDGMLDLRTLVDVCPMGEREVLALLEQLMALDVVDLLPPLSKRSDEPAEP